MSVGADIINAAVKENRRVLTEYEAKEFLKSYGLPVTAQYLVSEPEEAVAAAEKIGYPVVLKLIAEDIIHKSDVGAVKLNINNAEEVRNAFNELMAIPSSSEKKISVQEMAPEPITELIIGTVWDVQFGPAIMFGIGGVLTEIIKDVSFRVCPITEFDAKEMITEIKGYKLLEGYRGKPRADLKSLIKTLVKVSKIAVENKRIDQMDLNPVFIYNKGLKIVDARIILKTGGK